MDAKELTKVVNDLSNRLITVENTVKYLENYLNTLKTQVADINIDVKMLEARR